MKEIFQRRLPIRLITWFYAQYRKRSAMLRNHLKIYYNSLDYSSTCLKILGHTRRKFFSISESRSMAWIPCVTACIFHEPRHHARLNTPVNTAVIWYCLYRNMYILYSVCILVFFVAYVSITCASIEMLSSDIIFRSTSTL